MFRRRIASASFLQRASGLRFLTVTPVMMPALSPTMAEGSITEWSLKIGDLVEEGSSFCKVQTDKAVVAFDNVASEGYVARFLAEAPTGSIKVGDPILLLVDEKSGIDSAEVKNWKAEGDAAAAAAPAAVEASPAKAVETASAAAGGSRVFASPLAKKTAAELGVDLRTVQGTGGSVGRVTKQDVQAVASGSSPKKAAAPAGTAAPSPATAEAPRVVAEAPAAPAKAAAPKAAAPAAAAESSIGGSFTDIPVTQMRATIAKRLTQSKNVEVPHYYLTQECIADNMLATIKLLNAKGAGAFKITVNDYIVKVIARANRIVPACNSSWMGDHIRQYDGVDVSVAVATPTGLITPIIKNAHLKGLADISIETKALAKKAREGTLQINEFVGGTVSVSNLGATGIPHFTAIINPPQAMILAVGSAVPKLEIVKNADGEFESTGKINQVITFSASFDHRVVDGAVGAEWFKHFKDAMENPMSLLL